MAAVRPRYRPLESTEPQFSEEEENREHSSSRLGEIAHSLAWIAASAIIWHFSQFWTVVRSDPRVRWFALISAIACVGVNLGIVVFMLFIAPKQSGKNQVTDVIREHPRLAPTAGAISILGWFLFIIAFWPVWRIVTPVIVTVFLITILLSGSLFPPYS